MRFRTIALAVTLAALCAAPALAQDITAGTLRIAKPWSRATPGGAKVGGGYLTITNTGTTPDRLVSATTTVADHVEIHEMATKDGVMTMRPLASGLAIEPGKTVALAPGSYHLMLMNLKAPLKQGDKVPVTLTFEKAGKVDVTLDVQGLGAREPGAGGAMHRM